MPAAIWRIRGIDTPGDLILTTLKLYLGSDQYGAVQCISSSHEAVGGSLNSLMSGSEGFCAFAHADAISPGFWIEFELEHAATCWCAVFASSSPHGFIYNYTLQEIDSEGRWKDYRQGRVVYPGDGVASLPSFGISSFSPPMVLSGAAGSRGATGVAISDDGQTIAVAAFTNSPSSALNISRDGGKTWTASAAESGGSGFRRVCMTPDGRFIVAAASGSSSSALSMSRDYGITWSKAPLISSGGFFGCAISDDGRVIAAAPDTAANTVHVSVDGGENWSTQNLNLAGGSGGFLGCSVSPDGSTILLSNSGSGAQGIAISRDRGKTWEIQYLTHLGLYSSRSCVALSNGLLLVAGETSGAPLCISRDNGVTWEKLSLPSYSEVVTSLAASFDGLVILVVPISNSAAQTPCISKDGGKSWDQTWAQASMNLWGGTVSARGGYAIVSGIASGSTPVLSFVRDPTYVENPIALNAMRIDVISGDQVARGSTTRMTLYQALDLEFGGKGAIYGTVRNEKSKEVLQRRVRLFRSRDGYLVRETWSNADGAYRFDEINERYEYDIEAWDHERNYFTAVANNQLPEVAL